MALLASHALCYNAVTMIMHRQEHNLGRANVDLNMRRGLIDLGWDRENRFPRRDLYSRGHIGRPSTFGLDRQDGSAIVFTISDYST